MIPALSDQRIPLALRNAAADAALALVDAEIEHRLVLAEKMPDAGDPLEDAYFHRAGVVLRARRDFHDAWRAVYDWRRKNPEA